MNVEKLAVWMPVSDEAIVEYGIGTPEQQQAAAERIEARRREVLAAWRALPWWIRASRRLRARRAEYRIRIAHAGRALRGIECEP